MKKLVVTADDVGLHPGMTRGALAAADAGIVTAVSVASVGRAFDDAIDRLRDRPDLDVGIHLTLVGERPLSPPDRIPSLIGRNGALLSGYGAFTRRWLAGGINRAHLEAELRRQLERLLATGLHIVHLNSHQHLHVLPPLCDAVLRLAAEHGIPFVRIPNDPGAARSWTPRGAQLAVLNYLGGRARIRLEGDQRALDRTIGLLDAGHLSVERLRRALPYAGGASELVCHPGVGTAELAAVYVWDYDWDRETETLCDPAVPDMLRAAGIEVTRFSEL